MNQRTVRTSTGSVVLWWRQPTYDDDIPFGQLDGWIAVTTERVGIPPSPKPTDWLKVRHTWLALAVFVQLVKQLPDLELDDPTWFKPMARLRPDGLRRERRRR